MCGIFGYIANNTINDKEILHALARRGPDSKGIFRFTLNNTGKIKNAALLHTRLSIIDLSTSANQPMQDSSGKYTIIYNGEIYNFKDIREELEKEGIVFRTNSDTEVILLGYKKWGIEILSKLRGMFAFCILDKNSDKLFLARDPFGMKPLYFYNKNDKFCFSSTITAIFKSRIQEKFELDTNSIVKYINIGSFLAPNTIVKAIHSLLPGNYMIYNNGNLKIKNYYSIENKMSEHNYDYTRIKQELRELFFDTVKKHLISDAPLGVFLSGGIDSSLIAAIASKISKEQIHTFTVEFNGLKRFKGETKIAEDTANFIGAVHQNISVDNNSFHENFNEFIDAIDVPSIDGFNTFLISKAVKDKVKVILSGLGGDEIFSGYPVFHEIFHLQRKKYIDKLIRYLPKKILWRINKNYLESYNKSVYEILASKRCLYGENKNGFTFLQKYYFENKEVLKSISVFEIKNYMANMLLRDTDAVTMFHSLECRTPFVDKEVIKFALSVPDKYKIEKGINKPLLVHTFSDLLIEGTYSLPKRGFNLPVSIWMEDFLSTERTNRFQQTAIKFNVYPNECPFNKKYPTFTTKETNKYYQWMILISWIEKNKDYLMVVDS